MSVVITSKPMMLTQVNAACECGHSLTREGKSERIEGRDLFPHVCQDCKSIYLLSESFPVLRSINDLLYQYQTMANEAIKK